MKKNTVLEEQDLITLLESAGRPLHLDDILRMGHYSRRIKRDVLTALQTLAEAGSALRIRGGGWIASASVKTCRGRFAAQRSGAGFVTPQGNAPAADIYVAPEHAGGAWNGDLVLVALLPGRERGQKEGRVLEVLERACRRLAARVLHRTRDRRYLCRPADPRMMFDLLVSAGSLEQEPRPGDILDVIPEEELESAAGRPLWSGSAAASLGQESDAAVQERLTKLNFAVPEAFPDNVVDEAERAAAHVSLAGLEDLRGELLVTIDGEDARDFDDAVCAAKEGGAWRLLVAIADVSHFVRPGSALDREARERGNSFYFPLSMEPMLPHALCNGACSLVPGEERRCMAVEMRLDPSGHFVSSRFCNAVMLSRARLTYRQVQDAIDDPAGEAAQELERTAPGVPGMLRDAAELASVLIRRRSARGGLDLDLPEAAFTTEGSGAERKITGVHERERLFSHRLIEAFMVRANECVAEFLARKGAPFLYRAHPDPDPEKLEGLARSLRAVFPGLHLPGADVRGAGWLRDVLDASAEDESRQIIAGLVLRSLMQARYTTEKEGHCGLASACYCHFTSPIRRYADLENHRALKHALGLEPFGPALHELQESALQCNLQERAAAGAEREVARRMSCLLLQDRLGEEFEGLISGVTSFGFFVQMDGMPAEGMVKVEDLPRDWYDFDAEAFCLRGIGSGRTFRLGQQVTVRLVDVNLERLEINVEYQDKNDHEGTQDGRDPGQRRPKRGGKDRPEGRRSAFARRTGRGRTTRFGQQEERSETGGGAFSRSGDREEGGRRGYVRRAEGRRSFWKEEQDGGRRKTGRRDEGSFREGCAEDDGRGSLHGRRHADDRPAGRGGDRYGGRGTRFHRHEDEAGGFPPRREGYGRDRGRFSDERRPQEQDRRGSRWGSEADDFSPRRRDESRGSFRSHEGHGPRRQAEGGWDGGRPGEERRSHGRRSGGYRSGDAPEDRRGRSEGFRRREGREDGFDPRSGRDGKRPFNKDGRRRDFDRGPRKDARPGGTPEEFFRMEPDGEKKPAFRFGKRKK
ncbi:MAG: VacB/RNase II family 3'-5' exoribonuclease [Desulfovibrio sp.]